MPKVSLTNVTNITGNPGSAAANINANFQAISEQVDLLVSRDAESPNTMQNDLDMNSNEILNLGSPTTNQSAARWADVLDGVDFTGIPAPSQSGNANLFLGTDGSTATWRGKWPARTTVEVSAGITPSDYDYPPYYVTRYGVVSDGTTSQTSALVALLTAFGANNHLTLEIPANTVFAPATVFAAVPTGVRLLIHDTTNWGQPPGYRNRFAIEYTGDTVSNDTQSVIASGHHPAQMFLNMGTAGSGAASARYASQLHGVGRDYAGDPILGWLMQYAKDPSNDRWRVSWRLQTPYSVAVANPQPWVTATVYAAGAYCSSDSGKIYRTTAGGTSGVTAPTGTGSPSDGAVTWVYQQAALNIDSTRFEIDENGNVGQYGPVAGAVRFSQFSGARSHYFELDDATDDVVWRDGSRGLDIARISTTNGLQFGVCESFPFQTMTGATPTLVHSYAYVNNGGAVTMTNMSLPGSQTSGYAMLFFANGNTTIQHGANFVLRGAVNVTPTAGQIVEFVKYSTHSGAWIERSRNF